MLLLRFLCRQLGCLQLAHDPLVVFINLKFVRLDALHLLPDSLDAKIRQELSLVFCCILSYLLSFLLARLAA